MGKEQRGKKRRRTEIKRDENRGGESSGRMTNLGRGEKNERWLRIGK